MPYTGANGLAAPRDFQTPVASFEDNACSFKVLHKLCGRVFEAQQDFSPFNVVAWHGNYAPYKYDLARFCPVNTVRCAYYSADHVPSGTCRSDWLQYCVIR